MGCRFFSEPCLLLIQDIYMPTTIIQFLTNSSTFFLQMGTDKYKGLAQNHTGIQ